MKMNIITFYVNQCLKMSARFLLHITELHITTHITKCCVISALFLEGFLWMWHVIKSGLEQHINCCCTLWNSTKVCKLTRILFAKVFQKQIYPCAHSGALLWSQAVMFLFLFLEQDDVSKQQRFQYLSLEMMMKPWNGLMLALNKRLYPKFDTIDENGRNACQEGFCW